ncbi:zinc finger protein 428 [Ciconia boyciana]|uniref:zinc finger protein 428 n=1 Tax=Ciconia boyciana TaxID=52775 RepID=UPI003B9F9396
MAGAGPALPSLPCDCWRPRPPSPPPPLPPRPHSSRIAEPPSRGQGRREVERGGGASASCRRPVEETPGRRAAAPVPLRAGGRSRPPLREALNFQLRPGSGGRTIQHGSGGGRDHSARQPEGRPASALPPRPCAGRRGGAPPSAPAPPGRAPPRFGRPLASAAARALRLNTCQAGLAAAGRRRGAGEEEEEEKEKEKEEGAVAAVLAAACSRWGPAGCDRTARTGAALSRRPWEPPGQGVRGSAAGGAAGCRGRGAVEPCRPGAGGGRSVGEVTRSTKRSRNPLK